jgi:hypothetical protein
MNKSKATLTALIIATACAAPASSQTPPGPPHPPGTQNVNVTNTVPVIVGNSTSNPIPVVSRPAGTPYSIQKLIEGCNANCTATFPLVPVGKILVIEYVMAWGGRILADPTYGWLSASPTIDGGEPDTFMAFPMVLTQGVNVASVPMLAFVKAGSAPKLTIAGAANMRASISGYLMDAP